MSRDVSGNEENMGMLAELQGVSSNAKGKSNENTNKRWRHKNILTHHHVTMPMRSRTGQGCGSFRRVYGRDLSLIHIFSDHDEFQDGGQSRVTQIDDPTVSLLPASHNHATQVAGTIAAAGFVPNARGGAFDADIAAYDSVGDIGEIDVYKRQMQH